VILNFIDGQYRQGRSGRTFDDINPADGSLIAQVSEASLEDVDEAVRAARQALTGPWGLLKLAQRCDLLYAIAAEIDRAPTISSLRRWQTQASPGRLRHIWTSRAAQRIFESLPIRCATWPPRLSRAMRPTASPR